jgi:hypothetical protein
MREEERERERLRGIVLGAMLLASCAGTTERPACSPETLAALETAYVAEVLSACADYDAPELCPVYEEIRVRYAEKRKAWEVCE